MEENQIREFKSIHVDLEKDKFELNGIDISNQITVDKGVQIAIYMIDGNWIIERNLKFINSNLKLEIEEKE